METLLLAWARRALWAEQPGWAPIAATPTAALTKDASPFLLQSLAALVSRDGPISGQDLRLALALTADSFLQRIPPCRVRIPEGNPARITLPRSGQVLTLGSGSAVLAMAADAGKLAAEGDAALEPDRQSVRVCCGSLANTERSFVVTVAQDPSLFDDMCRSSMVADAEPNALEEFGGALNDALRLIGEADRGLQQCIHDDVSFYSVIDGSEEVHKSFSVGGLKGVIFLSRSRSPTRLAEAIVHEYGHSQLYWLADLDRLVIPGGGALYYSPWRPDPRPLIGLFHAMYVFENVACVLHRLSGIGFAGCASDIAERLSFIDLQLSAAIAQIERRRLSPSGQEIVDLVIQSMKERGAAPGHGGTKAMQRLQDHFAAWRSSGNPRFDGVDLHALLHKATELLARGRL